MLDASEDDPVAKLIGKRVGQYRIESKLGQGGMGIVFLAQDTALDRPVALKVLPHAAVGDQKISERFKREARAAARVCGVPVERLHFLDLPFYHATTGRRRQLGTEDIARLSALLCEFQPHLSLEIR